MMTNGFDQKYKKIYLFQVSYMAIFIESSCELNVFSSCNFCNQWESVEVVFAVDKGRQGA